MIFRFGFALHTCINLIFIALLIRSGIEILSALPKPYWHDHAIPGTEWIKFSKKKFPPDIKQRVWISLEEEESFSSWICITGTQKSWDGETWHFFSIIFWIADGGTYYILLFTSNEWTRLIPTSWSVFPQALHTALLYASLHFPPPGNPYNPYTADFLILVLYFFWAVHDCHRSSNVTSYRCPISTLS